MVQINFAHKEIQCKIVYYGPGMSGKTTNLELVHSKTPNESRGELTSIATTGERTLYFDYMPLDLGAIAGIRTKFQLYTVPGQIYYKSTRRLVLQGVDGIVFVADSSASKLEENRESMKDLEENLREMGRSVTDLPIVIQYNKRDLPDAMSIDDLEKQVNVHAFPHFEAVAPTGQGIFPTLKALAAMVLEAVNRGGIGAQRGAPKPVTPAGVVAGGAVSTPGAAAPAAAASPAAPGAPKARPAISFESPKPVTAPSAAPAPGRVAPVGPPRTAVAASGPSGATAVATAPEPAPAPTAKPMPKPPRTAPAPAPAPTPGAEATFSSRPVNDRIVKVSGLGRPSGGGRVLTMAGLAALIAAAVWFAVTRLL
jgi:signal recognition particle receptor subunit beta